MTHADLFDELLSEGVAIGGINPKNTLYGSINGDKRFIRVGKGAGSKWGLAGRDDIGAGDAGRSNQEAKNE